MKNWLKENKFIIILLVITLGSAFYWYEWRPTQIRKECFSLTRGGGYTNPFINENAQNRADFEFRYKNCLLKNGLEK